MGLRPLVLAGALLGLFATSLPARAGIEVFTSEAAWDAALAVVPGPAGTISQSILTQVLPNGISHPPGYYTSSTQSGGSVDLDNGFIAVGPTTPTSGRRDTSLSFGDQIIGFAGTFTTDPASAAMPFYVGGGSFIPDAVPGFSSGGFLGFILDQASSSVDFPNLPAGVFPDEPYEATLNITEVALSVAEPDSAALMLLALGALALVWRRQRATAGA